MKITSITANNYRTIEQLTLSLEGTYVAISGKNNSGKSNVFRLLSSFFGPIDRGPFSEETTVRFPQDFPNWKTSANQYIECTVKMEIDPIDDAGLHKFVSEFVTELSGVTEPHTITFSQRWTGSDDDPELALQVGDLVVDDKYRVSELFKKLRSSRCVIFHNSTNPFPDFFLGRNSRRLFGGLAQTDTVSIRKASDNLRRHIQRSLASHESDVYELLGRLSEKYRVTLSPPKLDFGDLPIQISLGEREQSVPLDEWGSGTQNRTMILLNLLKARRGRDTSAVSDKITPILLIEEAECFLHPSAQAEFGSLLQALSSEFGVQVITTTHSPYMLSLNNPSANILLRRRDDKGRLRGTERVDTGGDTWMEPFGTILGVSNDAFVSWRDVLFQGSRKLVLVEGTFDAKYLELLRDPVHGESRLKTDAEIFAYDGTGFFANAILVRFLLNRFSNVLITFDLDASSQCTKSLEAIGLKEGKDFFAIGLPLPGKRDIEGLLPDRIRIAVYQENPDLVAAAMSTEAKEAKRKLKAAMFEKFRTEAKPGADYAEFYKLAIKIDSQMEGTDKVPKVKRRPRGTPASVDRRERAGSGDTD